MPLGARITGTDWLEGGLTADDAVAMTKALKSAGLDFVDVSSGNITPDSRPPNEPGYNVPIAEQVRRETGLPVRAVGMIAGAKQADGIVAEGKADMVAMARAFLDDPHWGWHAARDARRRGSSAAAICAQRAEAVAGRDAAKLSELLRYGGPRHTSAS